MSLKFLCEGLNRYVGPPRTQNYFCFQPTPAIFSISPHQHKNDKWSISRVVEWLIALYRSVSIILDSRPALRTIILVFVGKHSELFVLRCVLYLLLLSKVDPRIFVPISSVVGGCIRVLLSQLQLFIILFSSKTPPVSILTFCNPSLSFDWQPPAAKSSKQLRIRTVFST